MTGISCPNCGCRDFRTGRNLPEDAMRPTDWDVTKTERKLGYIRRRRVCRNCGHVVFTREIIEE